MDWEGPRAAGARRVIVLSDRELISRAIVLALNGGLEVQVLDLGAEMFLDPGRRCGPGECDLIIVAVSLPDTEPMVALARSSLLERIGRVPLLIISDRPFEGVPEAKISHLRFPFDPIRLRSMVHSILASEDNSRLQPALVSEP